MNQTKKRLSIINHAISITDVETIQLQVLKLAQLKSDEKIQEIVTAIQAENYAQAQGLINQYIDTPTENILQRTSQKAQAAMAEEDQAIIDEFDLFVTSGTAEKPQEIDINDFLLDELPARKKVETKKVDHSDYDALLNIDVDNVMSDNIEMDVAHTSKDTFFDTPKEKTKQTIDTSHIPKDTFFDTPETEKVVIEKEEPDTIETIKAETPKEEPATQEIPKEETIVEEEETFVQTELPPKEESLKELNPEEETRSYQYKAIPYIAQKLNSMKKQYPPIERSFAKFDSVENLLTKISQEGYTEEEIEETLTYIRKLTEENKETEASLLLLVCAATESKFAQFMLARELYKGTLVTKDIPEAFTQMHSLALEDYPEALCDLAQFYEHGIGTSKDNKKAERFYKEAMDFGIKRAEKHCKRLQKENRGFFKR